VIVEVTHTNHHAAADEGKTVTYKVMTGPRLSVHRV
jgi:hypothetical protein